jgi:hypothetical protein
MKKLFVTALLAFWAASACADDLGDAKKLFEQKQYAQAMEAYARLANAGNSEAQQLLGEMYWYGEGTAVDNGKAEMWFRKSADAGNVKAKAALGIMRDRVARRADIDYYVMRYDGADLKYNCAKPAIPEMSKSFDEVKKVEAEYAQWAQCHNGFVTRLNTLTPPEKAIPADIGNLMTEDEFARAQVLAGRAHAAAAAQAQREAAIVAGLNDTWRELTVRHLKSPNRNKYGVGMNEQELAVMRQMEQEMRSRLPSPQPSASR